MTFIGQSLLTEIKMILFTQSTAVIHNVKPKLFCLLQFFTDIAQNSLIIAWVFHVHRNPWIVQVFHVISSHPESMILTPNFNFTTNKLVKCKSLLCCEILQQPIGWDVITCQHWLQKWQLNISDATGWVSRFLMAHQHS